MSGPARDGGERRLQEIDADGLLHVEIPVSRRGYDPKTVDELLERAAMTIQRLQALDEPALEERRRTAADLLHRTLLLAQASADHHLSEAESSAAWLVADAQARASRTVAEAEHAAETLIEVRSAQARAAISGLLERRQLLEDELDGLERYAWEVRGRLREVFTRESTSLERALSATTRDRPLLREIDLTDPVLDRSSANEAEPASMEDTLAWARHDRAESATAVLLTDPGTRSA